MNFKTDLYSDYKLDSNMRVNQKGSSDFMTTHDYILNSKRL